MITFTQFEQENSLSETRDNAESGNKYDDNSIVPPLISEEEINVIDSGNESDDENTSTEILEDICDDINTHMSVNRRYSCYKIHDRNKLSQKKWKRALLST